MFRDFTYMDSERVQSIIAQLNEGVMTQIISGTNKEFTGKAGIAAGILTRFLPISLEATVAHKANKQSNKVLHDYAYTVALETLQDNGLLLEDGFGNWNRNRGEIPEASFILIRGSATFLDYSVLKNVLENENVLDNLFGNHNVQGNQNRDQRRADVKQRPGKPSKSRMQEINKFIDVFMKDLLLFRIVDCKGNRYIGTLSRGYLREESRDFIFKYGSVELDGWVMLAQVGRVTENTDKFKAVTDMVDNVKILEISSASDVTNLIVEVINSMQAAMSSVSYPDISVTPIAIYREITTKK